MRNIDPIVMAFATASVAADEPAGAPSMSDMYSAFGIADPSATPPPADPPAQGATDPEETEEEKKKKAEEEAAKNGGEPKPAEPPAAPPADPQPDKNAAAFAQMRIQNTNYQKMLTNIAGVLGIQNTNDPEQMMQALQQMVTKAQSKSTGIPEDFIQRQRETEEKVARYEQEQLKTQAYLSFQKVKDTYALTNQEVSSFADKLLEAGKNPFSTPMDLLNEYRSLYFDQILAKEREKAIQAEAERAAKANTHSTQPPTKDGKAVGDPAKISTVKEFESWLAKQP